MILTPLQKLPNNVGDLGKIIVATGFEWLPKVQKITNSGHTGCNNPSRSHYLRAHFYKGSVVRRTFSASFSFIFGSL